MNQSFLIGLLQNAGLLLAMLVVFDFLSARRSLLATLSGKVLAGTALGAIGITMIDASVAFDRGIVFDTRSVLLAVAGLFFGVIPCVIAVLMTAAFRLYIGGEAALVGVSVIAFSGMIGIAWRYMRRRRPLESISWSELYALGIVVHAVMLALMLGLPREMASRVLRELGFVVMVIHPLATVAMGLLFVQRLRFHRATAALAMSESRFRLLAENARDVIFRYDFLPRPRFTYVSPSSMAFTGYEPDEYYADPDLGLKLVHPLDRPLLEAARRGELPSERPLALRWIRKDGAVVWAEQRNTYLRDANGHIVAVEGIIRDISGSKNADAMIRMALRATHQGLYDLNVETGEQQVSEEYASMLGYDSSQFQETFETWRARLHPDDEQRTLDAYRRYIEGKAPEYRVEFRLRKRSGDWLWCLSLGSIVSWDVDGKPLRMMGTHTDITALKAAEQRAREAQSETTRLLAAADQSRLALLSLVEDQQSAERQIVAAERKLRRLTEILEASQAAAHVGGWELDATQATLFWTDETYRIHDTSPAEYRPDLETALRFFTPESIPLLQEVLRDAAERRIARSVELELVTAAGRRKWVNFTSSVTLESGREARVTCAIQDITARKAAERERLDLMNQLHQTQNLESLGSLAGGVAHDMNNVLAAILSSAEACRRHLPADDAMARTLDTIANACVRGRSVVRSLLYFARGTIETHGPVDLNDIARELVDLLDKTTLKKIDFITDLEPRLPQVEGDHAALNHALMNICINAVDAMRGGGALTIRTRSRDNDLVEISVQDTGTGMTPEVQARAVEPFFTTKPVGKGTGLGLAMVYGTVKAHGGTLTIDSEPDVGTEVTLVFPAARIETQEPKNMLTQAEVTASETIRSVLVVDDDELIRVAMSTMLAAFGYEVRSSAGGLEALEQLESGYEPDVVILDVNMPVLSGPQTLTSILAVRPDQRVLLASGYGDEEMASAISGRPNVSSLRKPFTLDEFEAKLGEWRLRPPEASVI